MENKLIVKNSEGKDQTINVIDIVTDSQTEKKYLFYTTGEDEEVYASILKEKDSAYFLEAITDESEWELVEEILKSEVMIEGDTGE